jgi:N-acetylglutamate synthase-like GNAT family acetyltransferase
MKYREITLRDIPAIFEVRVATDENNLSYDELGKRGIMLKLLEEKIQTTCKGWLCEIENEVVGFVIANKKIAEIEELVVLPEHNTKMIKAKLLNLAEHWLFSSGKRKFWLISDNDKKIHTHSL